MWLPCPVEVSTGAASALGEVLPQLVGGLHGYPPEVVEGGLLVGPVGQLLGALFHGKGLAGKQRLVHEQIARFEQPAVGRNNRAG